MEQPLSNNTTADVKDISSLENKALSSSPASQQQSNIVVHEPHAHNLYPRARHIILISLVLFSIALIIFLMHQNGKSIYDNGL